MKEKTSLFEFSSIEALEKQIFDKYNSDEEFKREREKVYYKGFKISDIIERSGDHIIKETIKNLDSTKRKDNNHTIANIAASSLNNGVSCWLEDIGEVNIRKKKGYLTIATNCYVGCCFYQEDEFVSTGDNNYIIIKDNIFKQALDNDIKGYKLLAKYLTLIYHNKFHDWGRKLGSGNDFNREIILLPVYKDSNNQEVISVKTLSYLYDRIKFNEYKQKIEKLERERYSIKESLELYENNLNFEEEKKQIFYKAFRVGDLFERSTKHVLKTSKKELDISKNKTSKFSVVNVGCAKTNNGITGYLKDEGEVSEKKIMKGLHIATAGDGGSGVVFYQDTPFVSSGNNQLIIPNKSLQNLTNDGYKFISKALTKILFNRFHGFSRQAVSGVDFEREIIILPCYEDNSISTSKMAELYQKSVIKSKETQITERERAIKETTDAMLQFLKTI